MTFTGTDGAWKANVSVVTFDPNGGSGTMTDQSIGDKGKALNPNIFTKAGYMFKEWNTQADGSGTGYTDKQSIRLTSDITLYAIWELNPSPPVSNTDSSNVLYLGFTVLTTVLLASLVAVLLKLRK